MIPFPSMVSFRSALVLGAAGLTLLGPMALPGRSQDMITGCQLVEGTLQCVPGLTADPQQQIRILRKQIGQEQKLEAAVQQTVDGLDGLVLSGQAAEGGLLWASLRATSVAGLPASAYHWYRLAPGESRWTLIPGATRATYVPVAADVGRQLVVVLVVPQNGTIRRVASAPVGPVLKAP
jgi:hypothetical protein